MPVRTIRMGFSIHNKALSDECKRAAHDVRCQMNLAVGDQYLVDRGQLEPPLRSKPKQVRRQKGETDEAFRRRQSEAAKTETLGKPWPTAQLPGKALGKNDPWTWAPSGPLTQHQSPKTRRPIQDVYTAATKVVETRYKEDHNAIAKGERSIPTFRAAALGLTVESNWRWSPRGDLELHIFDGPDGWVSRQPLPRKRDTRTQQDLTDLRSGRLEATTMTLSLKDGQWSVYVTVNHEMAVQPENLRVLGVDTGIVVDLAFAVIEDDKIVHSRQYHLPESTIAVYERERRRAQERQARGKLPGKKVDHIKKSMIEQAVADQLSHIIHHWKVGIVRMEDLTGWSHQRMLADTKDLSKAERARRRRAHGRWHHPSWVSAIKRLCAMLGVEFELVPAAGTSHTCATCAWHETKSAFREGYGRVRQATFRCGNPSCTQFGKDKSADVNAAGAIARKLGMSHADWTSMYNSNNGRETSNGDLSIQPGITSGSAASTNVLDSDRLALAASNAAEGPTYLDALPTADTASMIITPPRSRKRAKVEENRRDVV